MINDLKLLNLQKLGKDFQQRVGELRAEQLDEWNKVAEHQRKKKVASVLEKLMANSGEAGSDGLEEEAEEVVPSIKQITALDPKSELECRSLAAKEVVAVFISSNGISQKLSWLPHQLMAYFGTWKAVSEDGVYSPKLTYEANVIGDYFALGSVLLAKTSRGDFFKGAPKGNQQYKSPINPLVPIILAGFKRYQNIPYMAWKQDELTSLLDEDLLKLVGVSDPQLSVEEITRLRMVAITNVTGTNAGVPGNPATSIKLNHLADTPLESLPKLAKYMVLQTWVAHPNNRDKYSILDLDNWDNIPAPLVEADFFPTAPKREVALVDLPW